MPVRIRITLLFTLLFAALLTVFCISVYYFSYYTRINSIKNRLTNRAITVGSLLNQSNFFSTDLIRKIDSSTSFAYSKKVIQAYDYRNNKIYEFKDKTASTFNVSPEILNEARINGTFYFSFGTREAVAYYYANADTHVVLISAGEDREGRDKLRQLSIILVLSYLIGLTIGATAAYFFSRGLLKPVKKISDEVNHISASNLSKRIKTSETNDEWQYLSNTLNSLLNRMQESFNMQKRFIANASHELSTPLTSISNQLEVSLQRERNASEYQKVIKSVYQDVVQMSKLTRTLLDFANASGTQAGIELTAVRIDEILLRLPAEMKKLSFTCSVSFNFEELPEDESRLLVYGNEELLFTAIKNIVTNACKYSNGRSMVTLGLPEAKVEITVNDKGKGIPIEQLDHIFEPFFRGNDKKGKEGFGLGLSLASRIIKLHKGEIKVTSQLGKGSTFKIVLPIAKVAAN